MGEENGKPYEVGQQIAWDKWQRSIRRQTRISLRCEWQTGS